MPNVGKKLSKMRTFARLLLDSALLARRVKSDCDYAVAL